MSITLSAEVSFETAEQLERQAAERGLTISALVEEAVRERLRTDHFPGIYFAAGPAGRRAKLVGGPDVWEVAFVARGYDMDEEKTAEHLSLAIPQVRLALAYHRAYPEEFEERSHSLEEFESDPERFWPAVRIVEV